METGIYSVFDVKANAYLPIYFAANDEVAMRSFHAACMDSGHQFGHYPEDYCLFRLGLFDDNTGVIQPECEALITAQEVLAHAQRNDAPIRSGAESPDSA